MSIISFEKYKEKFEKILTEIIISKSEFDYFIEDLIEQTPRGAMQLDPTPFLIRTSLLDENETCTNVSRCSYVPDSKRNRIPLQRCNLEKQQVFYASIPGGMSNFRDGAQPSLMETTMQKIIDDPTFDSKKAVASRWQIKHPPLFWFLPHYASSINSNENFKFLFNQFEGFLKNNSESIDDHQNFTKKLNYLSQLFCRNYEKEKTYKVTAAYYNKVMSVANPDNSYYDALIYPSANTKGEGMNIVLTKDYVDKQNIYCDLVVLYEINRNPRDANNVWFTPTAQAVPDKFGNLDFKPLNKSMVD